MPSVKWTARRGTTRPFVASKDILFFLLNNQLLRDGPITAHMRLDHTGVVPGERLEVSSEVANESSRDIDGVNIMLLETSIFKKTYTPNTRKCWR